MSEQPHQSPPTDARLDGFQQVLNAVAEGDPEARNRLWTEFYPELRELVVAWYSGRGNRQLSIGPTHIVGELWQRMHQRSQAFEHGRRYLFKSLYTECARIYLDHLKRRRRHHSGRVECPSNLMSPKDFDDRLDTLDSVLEKLRTTHPLDADIAAMKLLESVDDEANPGAQRGLRNPEIAERLGVSLRLVEKRWKLVKALLFENLG